MIRKQKNIFKKLFKIETVLFTIVKIDLTKYQKSSSKILMNGFENKNCIKSLKTDILDFLDPSVIFSNYLYKCFLILFSIY